MRSSSLVLNVMCNDVKIFEKKNEYRLEIYNESRLFKINISHSLVVRYNQQTKSIIIVKNSPEYFYKILESVVNDLLFSFNRLWHLKIKFKGKGFKVKRRKRTKTIRFFFYHSHVNAIILKKTNLKQRKKNKFIIKAWSRRNIITTSKKITSIKQLNIYTKRGIRTSRQMVFKKTGKKSNY